MSWATQVTIWANALHGDVAIRWARTSAGAPAGELTPYTMQFAIEAHERFLRRPGQPRRSLRSGSSIYIGGFGAPVGLLPFINTIERHLGRGRLVRRMPLMQPGTSRRPSSPHPGSARGVPTGYIPQTRVDAGVSGFT